MAPTIPPQVAEFQTTTQVLEAGLPLFYRGKVRDTFELPSYPDLLLQTATNRVSIYDFVLPCLSLASFAGNWFLRATSWGMNLLLLILPATGNSLTGRKQKSRENHFLFLMTNNIFAIGGEKRA